MHLPLIGDVPAWAAILLWLIYLTTLVLFVRAIHTEDRRHEYLLHATARQVRDLARRVEDIESYLFYELAEDSN